MGGPIYPANVITDADLQENGGAYVLQGRVAFRVQGFTGTERAVQGGPSVPVYVVTEAQIDSGQFRLAGGAAYPMTEVSDRAVSGRQAIPVYVTGGSL